MKTMTIGFILIIACAIEYGYGQNKLCGLDKFQCKNEHCIASELLCDGRADCEDGSDETREECSKPGITCPGYAFRCAYGACVDGDKTCNGVKDCIDNSDETISRCRGSQHNSSTTCSTDEFKCSNGECISASNLCDGTPDCADKSDETFIQCGSIACSQLLFRCHYGACIDGNLKCNGVINCADSSDENPELCGSVTEKSPDTDTSPWIPLPTREFCNAPPQPQNGYRKLHKSQCSIQENCDIEEGTELQPGAYLVYTCRKGYKIKGSPDVVCGVGGKWLNIPICEEIRCKSLLSTSVTAWCKYDDQEVSCDSALPRTQGEMSCRNSYRPDITSPLHLTVRCNENGQWEPEPMRCIPECGITHPNATPLIVNGTRPNITEFPWHATIYRAEAPDAIKEFICGATIIHEKLLVTAAHCVFIERTKTLDDPSKYYILTGNIYKDYDSILHNPLTVKRAKVKNIYIVCNYLGLEGNYAGDIAILEITKPFVFSSLLLPICLDIYHQVELEVGTLGKVAGFGKTQFGTYSSILQSLTVPYIPLNQCLSSSDPFETKRYVTIDKFCAGYTNGSSVCDGDSGGGLVVQSGNLWYLKGIVSVSLGVKVTGAGRTCDSTTYSLYTIVSRHMTWIQDVILRLQINKSFPSCFTVP
ncbi:modular serine protease-like [Hylaeus anthracinus]|uniref:modular serine protease-like n=1 Tax=Hylaeus anthracinus TaxID=313031 RepID=UPI0023B8B447|nr:modular serine protease-like [Hylaeus anthracinus]